MKNLVETKLNLIVKCIQNKIEEFDLITNYNLSGLLNGDFGIILFLLYNAHYFEKSKDKDLIDKFIIKRLNNIGNNKLYSFSSGISGILYLFDFLKEKELLNIDISEIQNPLHNYIIQGMKVDMEKNSYDYLHGPLGVALYFLKINSCNNEINLFIDYLYNIAEKDFNNHIFKWKSLLLPIKKIGYNISLSHGIASLIIFFSRILKIGTKNPYVETMLHGAINYVLSQEIDFTLYGSFFPSWIIESSPPEKSRLSWCYGDLGIAIALWQAGKATNNIKWKNKALTIFQKSTYRTDLMNERIIDAGLCHGTAGVSMIYRRMFLETEIEIFRNASKYWMEQTLNMAHFGDGLAGYKSFNSAGKWENDYSLLMGVTGIGLFINSYLRDDSQAWDEILLLS